MGQALYRKYRSKSLDEIVGQEHVTTTLSNALKSGRISHAYLLSGPRGVGKTSIARILAHEINGLPYDDETQLDIIEIDAASNRGIDEIRELRERVNIAPAKAKYKVYIIDEVHMLTTAAFNAILKTLEEPPSHVIFILATTEAYKLPETIVSRTQRYNLRPVPERQVVEHLSHIAKSEKIHIDDDALRLIAQHGEGSFRDSISLLDQASSVNDHITRADVEQILGLAPDEYISRLESAITENDSNSIVTVLGDLYAQGFEPAMVAQQLSTRVRELVIRGTSPDQVASLRLLEKLLDIPAARNPRQLLEIVLLRFAVPEGTSTVQAPAVVPQVAPQKKVEPVKATLPVVQETVEKNEPVEPEPTQSSAEPAKTSEAVVNNTPADDVKMEAVPDESTVDLTELWQQTLDAIKNQYNTLYGITRMAQPSFDGQRLTLAFKFAFHQKRINEVKNRKILADTVEKIYGHPIEIVCVIADDEQAAKPDMSAISNIFGSAELLES